jgi:long-chain fatty acid omega-monooxygenase
MPYTEAILFESQRLSSVIVILPPHRAVEDTILDGYKIPKDTVVLLNTHSTNMDPDIYPDPNSFRPERFINKDGIYQTQESLIQFGRGQ